MRTLHSLAGTITGLALLTPGAQAQLDVLLLASISSPTVAVSPPVDTSRLFIATQGGRIRVIKDGSLNTTDFLNITPIVLDGGERGLLGLAFHPFYANNRQFFVSYTDNSGASVIRRYLRSTTNPDQADASSGVIVYGPLDQPFPNHNGGCIQFGSDKMLYLGLGDGGSGNDPDERAQDQTSPFGKMLRFDVDLPFPHVPLDNPFVGGDPADDLTWSKGLRNPWKFSFDRLTGDLWIADVGQDIWEEIDFEPPGAGGRNYGWDCMEGDTCTGESPADGSCACNDVALTDPVHTYGHALGCSITGGIRYRGSAMPSYVGRYFFADYCSGRVWSFDWDGSSIQDLASHTNDLAIPGTEAIIAFGEDANGELYICDQDGGQIWAVFENQTCVGSSTSFCITAPNSNSAGATISSNGGTDLSDDDFELIVTGAASNQPGLFYYSTHQNQAPFGNGFRCVSGSVYRLPVVVTDGFGDATHLVDLHTPPAGGSGPGSIQEGSTWYFQFWFRDPQGGGEMFNLSDGLAVSFCP